MNKDLSIVVPLFNEEESLRELTDWIENVVTKEKISTEIIFVNDGSTDKSWDVISSLKSEKRNLTIKGVRFRRNYGKSAALHCGFEEVEGDVTITMDADLQDSPDEIPELYRMIKEGGFDLVSGWKKRRYDPLMKTIPSKLYNRTARAFSGIKLHDFNCGLKAYNSDVVKSIEVFGEMHRYIPVIAKSAGFQNIGEKVVQHQARKYGVTKFGLNRFVNGYLDLMTITFMSKFGKRPMHFFGLLGSLMFILGFIAALWIGVSKLWALNHGLVEPRVTESAFFYLSLVCMILGSQLFLTGFIAEIVSRNSSERNTYLISEKL